MHNEQSPNKDKLHFLSSGKKNGDKSPAWPGASTAEHSIERACNCAVENKKVDDMDHKKGPSY